jgi:hypothetical protein
VLNSRRLKTSINSYGSATYPIGELSGLREHVEVPATRKDRYGGVDHGTIYDLIACLNNNASVRDRIKIIRS